MIQPRYARTNRLTITTGLSKSGIVRRLDREAEHRSITVTGGNLMFGQLVGFTPVQETVRHGPEQPATASIITQKIVFVSHRMPNVPGRHD
jgi:hypothetical protein